MTENDSGDSISGLHLSAKKAKAEISKAMKASVILLAAFCLMEFAMIFHLAMRQTVSIPYVIEINRDGTAKYVDNASTSLSEWKPSVATTLKVLEDYIISLRGVCGDDAIQRERIRKVYAHSTESALKTAQDWLLENNPLERSEKERVEISVYAATPYMNGNEHLFQLDWNEKTYGASGNLKSEANYRAIMGTRRYVPKTKSIQEANPLGIYVVRLDISEIKDGYVIYESN